MIWQNLFRCLVLALLCSVFSAVIFSQDDYLYQMTDGATEGPLKDEALTRLSEYQRSLAATNQNLFSIVCEALCDPSASLRYSGLVDGWRLHFMSSNIFRRAVQMATNDECDKVRGAAIYLLGRDYNEKDNLRIVSALLDKSSSVQKSALHVVQKRRIYESKDAMKHILWSELSDKQKEPSLVATHAMYTLSILYGTGDVHRVSWADVRWWLEFLEGIGGSPSAVHEQRGVGPAISE